MKWRYLQANWSYAIGQADLDTFPAELRDESTWDLRVVLTLVRFHDSFVTVTATVRT
jgi:hypothetical protein